MPVKRKYKSQNSTATFPDMNYTAPNSAQLTHLISTLRPPLKPVRQIRQPTYFPKHYRTLREIDVKRIVMARFHSLTDCSKIFASFPEISKRHRIPLSTCFYAIKAFQQCGLAYVTNVWQTHDLHGPSKSKMQFWDIWKVTRRCKNGQAWHCFKDAS